MPFPTTYSTGTASVANGATTVTLVGAVSGAIYAGDLFMDPTQPLVPPQRIATDPVAGVFSLAVAWPGTSLTADPYEVRITPDSVRMQERTRQVLNLLDQAALPQGGDAGQVLGKVTGDDYDVAWVDDEGAATAADVSFAPAGSIAAATVQAAIEELDTEKQAASTNLTALAAAFTPASGATASGLALAEDTDNGTNKVTVKAPAAVTADRTFTLPDVDVAVSTFGASLLDDADAAAARTTIAALGGSLDATDNRLLRSDGTGGATAQNSPIAVDDSGNVSGAGTISSGAITSSGSIVANVLLQASQNGGSPFFRIDRSDAHGSGAYLGLFEAYGKDSAGNSEVFCRFDYYCDDNTNGSEDGSVRVTTKVAGTLAERAKFGAGLLMGAATGGDKGAGTINATDVYNDNVALTCMALQSEFLELGEIDLDKWDALVPDLVVPERVERVPVTYTATSVAQRSIVEEVDGRLIRRFVERRVEREVPMVWAVPLYDEAGTIVDAIETPVFEEVIIPEQIIPRTHGTARLFADMLAEGFDPRDPARYIAKLKADQALPGMPARSTWQHNSLSSGEMFGRLWLATEMLAIVVMNHEERLVAAGL